MFRTTKELHSCLAGAPTAMGHCVSRCTPRTSAGHALCRTMLVVAHDNRAPHACSTPRDGKRPCEASEARPPTRRMAVGGPSGARTPHDSTPSSSHERGTAGPEKGAMAFLDDTEATTYTMLKQVLQNHCTTQTLCLPHTLVACGALVALVCAQLDETHGALEPVVAHTLADLKRYTRARRTAPPLAPFPVECLAHHTPAHLAQSEAVFQALAQFLHDSLAAERVTLAGAVRIVLSLLADVFAMLTHQYAHTAAEVEARIDRLSSPLQSQITAYHRQRDQGG